MRCCATLRAELCCATRRSRPNAVATATSVAFDSVAFGSASGGERGRVHLAKTLREGCNLLLLDEPSNDLDIDTLRSLEEALSDFAGSAVVVSHDRWFLDRVCTHTLAFEPGGNVEFFEGSVSEYTMWRERHGKASAQMEQ